MNGAAIELDGNTLVTDGYTRWELADLINRKKAEFQTAQDPRKRLSLEVASRYIREPAQNPGTTPERKIVSNSDNSAIVNRLAEMISECLLLTERTKQTVPAKTTLDLEFSSHFNARYPFKLELKDDKPLKITFSSPTNATNLKGLHELLLAIPLDCRIHLELSSSAFGTDPTMLVEALVRYLGRVICSLKYLATETSHNSIALIQLIKELPQLRHLDLSHNRHLASNELKTLSTSAIALQTLNLSDNPHLTDQDAKAVAIQSPALKKVVLARCFSLGSTTIAAFFSECHFLRSIDISGITVTTEHLAHGYGTCHLEKITCEESTISVDLLTVLVQRYSNLKTLNLAGNSTITIADVQSLLRQKFYLSIDLSRCSQIYETAKEPLIKEFPYATLIFTKTTREVFEHPSVEELTLVHFSCYLAAKFMDSSALVYRIDAKTLFIRLTPVDVALDALSTCNPVVPNIEAIFAKYDVHLELSYEALTISPQLHPLGEFLLRLCPHVKQLDLLTYGTKRQIYDGWKFAKVETLTIDVATFNDVDLSFIQAPKATSLSLKGCTKLSIKSFSRLATSFPQLETLDLSRCTLTDALFSMGVFLPKDLQVLSIAKTSISDAAIEELGARDRKFTTLDLSYTEVGWQGLQKLELFPFLTKLQLNGCSKIDDEALCKLTYATNQFQEIEIRDCKQVTEAGIFHLLVGCKELKAIDASGCNFQPSFIEAIKGPRSDKMALCLNLEQGLSHLQAASIFQLHPKVTRLTLQKCLDQNQLNDVLSVTSTLQSLALDQGSLNEDAMCSIVGNCTTLETLEFHNLSEITQKGVEKLVAQLPKLKGLTFKCCSKIKPPELLTLRKKFSGISFIANM